MRLTERALREEMSIPSNVASITGPGQKMTTKYQVFQSHHTACAREEAVASQEKLHQDTA